MSTLGNVLGHDGIALRDAQATITPSVRKKVLVIEDDPTAARLLSHFLAESGHDVIVAGQADAGLRLARFERPDLITLELILPRTDGFQVLEKLREDPATDGIPVFVISSLSREEDVIRAIDLGAAEYFTKPFSPRIVVAKVRQALR